MKKRWLRFLVIMTILVGTALLIYISISAGSDQQDKDFNIVLSERIYAEVESQLHGPVMVSRAMSESVYIRDFLSDEEERAQQEDVQIMKEYLSSVKESGNFDTAYMISAATLRYYTDSGLNKIMDPENDSHDKWYTVFTESGLSYGLDVDVDEVNSGKYTIFVNVRINDSQGNLIGICGIGTELKHLQELFADYEKKYGVSINLVDSEGLVQANVSDINVESTYYSAENLSADQDITYGQKGMNGYVITKYIKDLNWYLIVDCEASRRTEKNGYKTIVISVLIMYVFMALMSYLMLVRGVEFIFSRGSEGERDGLTGLLNRNFFKKIYGEKGRFNTTRYKTVIVMDIDSFKEANDNINGDDMLVFLKDKTKELIGDNGEIFRWGGDEFVILSEWSSPFSLGICRQLCSEIEKDGRVTISVGITEVHMTDSVKTNYHRAKQACYIVKEMGGNGVKLI
ncbi:MAG: GGDEF domain-containing protein [Lachnospiraceae bacterium]|nr:GGDEF domain-containing protein [Lachnospiraceae bacterium]